LAGIPPLQCDELLAKSKLLKQQTSTRSEGAKYRAKQETESICHARLLSQFDCGTQRRIVFEIAGGKKFGE
jgi:hypothetical protein